MESVFCQFNLSEWQLHYTFWNARVHDDLKLHNITLFLKRFPYDTDYMLLEKDSFNVYLVAEHNSKTLCL